jgi:hypothetical protein
MGFILGFLMGLLAAIGLFGFLTYWLCSRPDGMAVAKFINGIAQALVEKKSSEPLAPGKNGKAMQEAVGSRKSRGDAQDD